MSVQRRSVHRLIARPACPGGVAAAVTQAGLMPYEHLAGVKIGDLTPELERDDMTRLAESGLKQVTFGIRPEQLELSDSGGVEVVVDLVEDLGSEAYLYTHAGPDVQLVARSLPRTPARLADTVRLRKQADAAVHLFHPGVHSLHPACPKVVEIGLFIPQGRAGHSRTDMVVVISGER